MITLLVILLVVNGGLPGMEKKVQDGGDATVHQMIAISLAADIAADPEKNPELVVVGDRVEVQLPGEMQNPPLPVPPTRTLDMSTPENAAFACQNALALGDAQAITSLYSLQERRSVKAMLDDHNTRAQMYLRPEASIRLKVHGVLYYGPYALVLLRYGTDPADATVLPLMMESGRWLRTNRLLGDPVFDHVLKAWVLGGIATGGTAPAATGDLPPMIPMMP